MSLRVRVSTGLVTVQDIGRSHMLHRGVPRAGALSPLRLMETNRLLGNDDNAAAIEVVGRLSVECMRACVVATSDGRVHELTPGASIEVEPPANARVAYVAVRGGIEVPRRMGSRSTWLAANYGGFQGRTLRRDDVLDVGDSTRHAPTRASELALAVRLLRGPDESRFASDAFETLLKSAPRISASSNRVATRLDGVSLPYDATRVYPSAPMIEGAIEVLADGTPIVLGPEHPITGGYPVIAFVATESLSAFHTIGVSSTVSFEQGA